MRHTKNLQYLHFKVFTIFWNSFKIVKSHFFAKNQFLGSCTALVNLPDVLILVRIVGVDSEEHEEIAISAFEGVYNFLERF